MATGNRFQVLAGLDDDDNVFDDESELGDFDEGDDFDEADMAAIGVLADGLQAPYVGFPAGALPAPALLPVVQIVPALAPAAVHPVVQVVPDLPPAAVLPGVEIGLALPPAVLAVDNTENPWTEVPARRAPRNPNAPRQEEYVPVPEARVCVEVPWVPKTGSLRCIKKHSQARKGGYVPTADEDSGSYIYGSFGTDALEF